MKKGAIDLMMAHWARERPDLDSSSLGVLARLSRLARAAEHNAEDLLSRFGLTEVEFLLLAAIRTAPDQQPSPRDLLDTLMVTSGGLTNRIDRLETAGHLVRVANPKDRRGIRLRLTESGRDLVDRVTTAYVENQNRLLDVALSDAQRATLADLLRTLLSSMTRDRQGTPEGPGADAVAAAPPPQRSGARRRGRPLTDAPSLAGAR